VVSFRTLCWRTHAEAYGDSQYPPDALVRRFDNAVGVPVAARVVNTTFEVKLSHYECEWDKGTQCRIVRDLLISDSVRYATTIGAMNAPTTLTRRIRTPRVGADVVARFAQPLPP
jgi:hypothetical protein